MAARDHINWDQHYGKAFRVVTTPAGASVDTEGNSIPDQAGRVSIVTPENGDAWEWPEASSDQITAVKNNWSETQTLPGSQYKMDQIRRSISE